MTDWITKTAFMDSCRCGYAFSMRRAGLVPPSGSDPKPESDSEPESVWPDWVYELFARKRWMLRVDDTPVIRNPELWIAGRPPGIDPADGAMIPILIFPEHGISTKEEEIEFVLPEVDWRDRWALAFYWLLLGPQRTRSDAAAVGYVVLPGASVKQYPLARDLAAVQFAIEKARQAIRLLSPYFCAQCDVCKARSAHRLQVATEQRSLALVTGISFRQALDLERAGIGTYDALTHADSHAISQTLRVSEKKVDAWKTMASAVATNSPIVLKKITLPLDPANMTVLDTEHGMWWRTAGRCVWLIGLRVYRHGECEDHIFWAADRDIDEYRSVKETARLLGRHRDLPVVTWNGRVDLRHLMRAVEAWTAVGKKIRVDWDDVTHRHIDMLKVLRESVALPVPKLGLKDVAQYFGVPADPIRVHVDYRPESGTWVPTVLRIGAGGTSEITIADGRDAVEALLVYKHSESTLIHGSFKGMPRNDRIAIREALKEYVRQDLRLTAEVTRHVVVLLAAAKASGTGSAGEGERN